MRTRILLTIAALWVVAITAPAQLRGTLLFTTLNPEFTLCPKPPSLRQVDPADVMGVIPPTTTTPTCIGADKWAPANAWCALTGDEDSDASIFEPTLGGGKIDALLWSIQSSYPTDPSMRDMYISTASRVGSGVSGVFADPGDVFRVQADGQFVMFLTAGQIKTALQIPATTPINVDAITLGKHPQYGWLIYLSLEKDHNVVVSNGGPMLALDGAVLGLQVQSLGEPVLLTNVAYMVFTEANANTMIGWSGVRDPFGVPITTIDDTDGLHLDPGGLMLQNQWGVWNNLWFVGERLTGGAVLSTAGGGTLALLNGVALASLAATTGAIVGLQPNARSLNGLHADEAPLCRFVTETPTPVIPAGGGPLVLEIEGVRPAPGGVFLLIGITLPATPIVSMLPLPPALISCFPEVMNPGLWIVPPGTVFVPANAQGIAILSFASVPPLGADVYVQAYNWDPVSMTARVSTPVTFE